MKKTVLTLLFTVLVVAVIGACVWADDAAIADYWGLSINVKLDTSEPTSGFIYDDTLAFGLYELSWSGSRSLTIPRGRHGELYGSIDTGLDSQDIAADPMVTPENEFLYKFFYKSDGEWFEIGQLFDDAYTYDNTSGSKTISFVEQSDTYSATVWCDGIGILYGAHYFGNGGSASGTVGMSASAVPEASTMVGLFTGAALNAGAFMGIFRRKKNRS